MIFLPSLSARKPRIPHCIHSLAYHVRLLTYQALEIFDVPSEYLNLDHPKWQD